MGYLSCKILSPVLFPLLSLFTFPEKQRTPAPQLPCARTSPNDGVDMITIAYKVATMRATSKKKRRRRERESTKSAGRPSPSHHHRHVPWILPRRLPLEPFRPTSPWSMRLLPRRPRKRRTMPRLRPPTSRGGRRGSG